MNFEFEVEGLDKLKKNLNNLANHPEQLLEGQTFQTQQEMKCEFCDEEFEVTVPVRIQKVIGNKGYGPGFSTKQECPKCGELNECTWAKTVVEIRMR